MQPVTVQQLRKLCGLRTATVCSCLAQLAEAGVVTHDSRGYQLNLTMVEEITKLLEKEFPASLSEAKKDAPGGT